MSFSLLIISFRPQKSFATYWEKRRSGIAGGIAIFMLAWVVYLAELYDKAHASTRLGLKLTQS